MFSTDFISFSNLFLFPLSITVLFYEHIFDAVSSNLDKVLPVNPSTIVFAIGDVNFHHKDWLTYFGGADRPGEFFYDFSNHRPYSDR